MSYHPGRPGGSMHSLSLLSAPTESGGRGCHALAPYYLQDENLTLQLAGTGGVSLRPHPSFLCTELTKAGHHPLSNVPPAVPLPWGNRGQRGGSHSQHGLDSGPGFNLSSASLRAL